MNAPDAFTAALERFDRLIAWLSYRFAGKIPGTEFEDLHQEGRIKLYELYTSPVFQGKPEEECDRIVKRSLSNRFLDLVRRSQLERKVRYNEMDITVLSEMLGEDHFQEVAFQQLLDHFALHISPDAERLLSELLEPSPRVLRTHYIHNLRRHKLRLQGFRAPALNKITHEMAGSVLGFTRNRTKRLIRELQHACVTHIAAPRCYKRRSRQRNPSVA